MPHHHHHHHHSDNAPGHSSSSSSSTSSRLSGHKRERDNGYSDSCHGTGYVKLFVGSVPRTISEEQVRPMFEEFGDVLEVAIIKDKRSGLQQGCCFVKYSSRGEADRAIRFLNNQRTLPGGSSCVQVRYADGERERLGAIEHKLFVGCLNKQASEKEIEEIFKPYGRVDDVYIMRDEHKQSRGCAFIKFPNRDTAQQAITALNNVYVMRGCDQPLAVRFADPKRPKTGDLRPRHGSGSSSNRSSGSSSRDSPINWRQTGLRGLTQNSGAAYPPVIPRASPASPASIHGQLNGISQSPYTQLVTAAGSGPLPASPQQLQDVFQTRSGQSFSQQGSVQQYVQLSQPPPLPYHQVLQQFNPPPPSQQSFSQLQQLTQQLPPIQQQFNPALQPGQQQTLQNQPLHIPQQQVFQPGPVSQQPSWLSAQLVQSLLGAPTVLPPAAPASASAACCNWSEHVSPEGYKYYYNSVTSESKWEKPEELLKVEQVLPPPPPDMSFSVDQLRQQVWI